MALMQRFFGNQAPNQNNQQISQNNNLTNGSGNVNDPSQSQNSQQQQSQNPIPEDEDDLGLSTFSDIFGKEEDNSDFDIPDDLINQPQLDADGNPIQKQIGPSQDDVKNLQTKMKDMLLNFGPRLEDIPVDMNWQDSSQVHGFMKKIHQQSIQQAVALMGQPMEMLAQQLRAEFKDQMESMASMSKVQDKSNDAFNPIREGLRHLNNPGSINFAKDIYVKALKQMKDPQKAALATARMVESTFNVKLNVGQRRNTDRRGQDDYNAPRRLEGKEAIANIFDMDNAGR